MSCLPDPPLDVGGAHGVAWGIITRRNSAALLRLLRTLWSSRSTSRSTPFGLLDEMPSLLHGVVPVDDRSKMRR